MGCNTSRSPSAATSTGAPRRSSWRSGCPTAPPANRRGALSKTSSSGWTRLACSFDSDWFDLDGIAQLAHLPGKLRHPSLLGYRVQGQKPPFQIVGLLVEYLPDHFRDPVSHGPHRFVDPQPRNQAMIQFLEEAVF